VATVNPETVTTWAKAVKDILRAANVPKTLLAEKLGVSHVVVVRFLNGDRTPSPDSVERINRAVEAIVGNPHLAAYLNVEAAASDLIQGVALVKDATKCLGLYHGFFRHDAIVHIPEIINSLEDRKRHRLAIDLARAFHRTIIEQLLPPSRPSGFSAIYDALKKAGIALDEIVSEESAAQLAREHFEWTVRREFAEANPQMGGRERLAAVERIVEAHDRVLRAAAQILSNGGLLEVRTNENGFMRSEFFGSSRKAFEPFMAPAHRAKIKKPRKPRQKKGKS
jgi:transcriptional regulator with XRE-family HTH domain